MEELPLRVIDVDFNLYTEVKQYSSLQLTRSWSGIGGIELVVHKDAPGASELLKGRIIFPHNHIDKAYIIRYREIELDADSSATGNWIIKAQHIKSWFTQRITLPPPNKSNDSITANTETVMLHLIRNNVTDPLDVERQMSKIALDTDAKKGKVIDWSSRYRDLSEELEKIGLVSGLGWNIELDLDNKRFVVKVLEGRNLSAYQSDNPPAIFSPEFKTLSKLNYMESDLDYKNYSYIAGQGEGKDRRVIELGEGEEFDRYELFIDARDIEEEIDQEEGEPIPRPVEDIERDLTNRGNQKLQEHEQEVYLEGEYSNSKNLIYRKDWDLGDIVTVQNKDWDITTDLQITEVKEIYEGGVFKVEPLFGGDRPDLISKIKQEMEGIDREMTK